MIAVRQVRQSAWRREVWQRIVALAWVKTVGISAFMLIFFWTYFALLRHPLFPVRKMPLTPVDHWIPYTASALPLYLSLWVYVSLPPSLIKRLPDLLRFGAYVGVLCLAGVLCFLLWPTSVPLDDPLWRSQAGIAMLERVDAAGNACPSLHVATAVFSCLWLNALLHEVAAPRWARICNGVWCAAIVYSTLAIRQHVVVDAVAGIILGAGFGLLSLAVSRRIANREKTT